MKNLLFAVLLLGGITAQANQVKILKVGVNINSSHSVTFIERGIQFTVYTNGNIEYKQSYNNRAQTQRSRSTRVRTSPGQTYGVTYATNSRKAVLYNRKGQIKQIGNTVIAYNRNGQVVKVGTRYIKYRNNKMASINSQKLYYNKRGKLVRIGNSSSRR